MSDSNDTEEYGVVHCEYCNTSICDGAVWGLLCKSKKLKKQVVVCEKCFLQNTDDLVKQALVERMMKTIEIFGPR